MLSNSDVHGRSTLGNTIQCTELDLRKGTTRYWNGDGNVTFTRPFLLLNKVTFDEYVDVLESSLKGDIADLLS